MAHTVAGEYKVSTILSNTVYSGRECLKKSQTRVQEHAFLLQRYLPFYLLLS